MPKGPRYTLISDTTLTHEYGNFPPLDFLPCAPANRVPRQIYSFLKGTPSPALPDGQTSIETYATRKMETALLDGFSEKDVVVPHEAHLERFITG